MYFIVFYYYFLCEILYKQRREQRFSEQKGWTKTTLCQEPNSISINSQPQQKEGYKKILLINKVSGLILDWTFPWIIAKHSKNLCSQHWLAVAVNICLTSGW